MRHKETAVIILNCSDGALVACRPLREVIFLTKLATYVYWWDLLPAVKKRYDNRHGQWVLRPKPYPRP